MGKKIFVLGLPGSGKSTAARLLAMRARDYGWSTILISDYEILYIMFKEDTEQKFRPTKHGGFDVLDLTMFDIALQELEQKTLALQEQCANQQTIIFLEFSRNDYIKALQQFSRSFLQDASFLFIQTDIPTCTKRIRERVLHPATSDDHFVSEYIFDVYYQLDNRQYLETIASGLNECCGINSDKIRVIENTGVVPIEGFLKEINICASVIFGTSVSCAEPAPVLEEVAPNLYKPW